MQHTLPKRGKDLSNQRFGRLTALYPTEKRYKRNIIWVCQCECKNIVEVVGTNLTRNRVQSCGCLRKELYEKWNSSHARKAIEAEHKYGTSVGKIQNSEPYANNKSGYRGVYWSKKQKIWKASIAFKGKRKYLGGFKELSDAAKAYEEAFKERIEELEKLKENQI